MNNETKIIEDNAVRIALYNDLKGLHRMATSFKAFVVSHNIEEAMLDYCGITVREFCEDKRADELTKERYVRL